MVTLDGKDYYDYQGTYLRVQGFQVSVSIRFVTFSHLYYQSNEFEN